MSEKFSSRINLTKQPLPTRSIQSDKEKMVITAPQAAKIIHVYRSHGDYVRAGEAIFMLADLSELNAFAV